MQLFIMSPVEMHERDHEIMHGVIRCFMGGYDAQQ